MNGLIMKNTYFEQSGQKGTEQGTFVAPHKTEQNNSKESSTLNNGLGISQSHYLPFIK